MLDFISAFFPVLKRLYLRPVFEFENVRQIKFAEFFLNKNFFQWYDENYEFFPLTYDYTFREVFKRNNIFLEKFVSDFLGVEFFGNAKVYFEDDYLKTYEYDVNNYDTFIYITINDCIELVAAVEREFFDGEYFQKKLKEFYSCISKNDSDLEVSEFALKKLLKMQHYVLVGKMKRNHMFVKFLFL